MAQAVDRSILQEIVRIIEARKKVPERVRVRAREYLITYLEDHQRRLQDALQRYDSDRLNMLYGQLASKVKYQLLRRLPGRERPAAKAAGRLPAARRSGGAGKAKPAKPAKKAAASRKPAKSKATKSKASKRTAAKRPRSASKKSRR